MENNSKIFMLKLDNYLLLFFKSGIPEFVKGFLELLIFDL